MKSTKTLLSGFPGRLLVSPLCLLVACHQNDLERPTQSDLAPIAEARTGAANGVEASASGLRSLLVEGHELHESLSTRQLSSVPDLPSGVVSSENPHLSTDDEFVEAIARGGSQGRLGREGIRSALYARYSSGEKEVGVYGLEAESDAFADQRERAVREIWAYNARLDRASVHRKDLVLVVIWHDGVSPECWESVTASVVKRLNALDTLQAK